METVSNYIVKPPEFWKKSPNLWFAVLEAEFETSNIRSDSKKYFTVLKGLDEKTINKISDIVKDPPETDKYLTIKKALISRTSESENSKFQKLLQNLDLGDRKPSELLREMKTLAGDQVSEQIVKQLWLQRLPSNISVILTISSEPLDNIANMADKIIETYSHNITINSLTSESKIKNNNLFEVNDLVNQINELKSEVQYLKRSRSRSNDYNRKSRSKSNNNNENRKDKPFCWYHYRFKNNATKCVSPCSFNSNSKN